MGGPRLPPLTENHSAKKNLSGIGGYPPPPLSWKNPISSIWQAPLLCFNSYEECIKLRCQKYNADGLKPGENSSGWVFLKTRGFQKCCRLFRKCQQTPAGKDRICKNLSRELLTRPRPSTINLRLPSSAILSVSDICEKWCSCHFHFLRDSAFPAKLNCFFRSVKRLKKRVQCRAVPLIFVHISDFLDGEKDNIAVFLDFGEIQI